MLKFVKEFRNHKDAITCVAIHPKEPFFASGSADSNIRIYDYELFEHVMLLKGHTHSVNNISWTNGDLLSCSSDMSIKLWKSANKTNPYDFKEFYCAKTFLGHEHTVS